MSNTEIVTFEQATSLTGKKAIDFFSDSANVYPLIEQVKQEALSLVPNVQTKKGRDEIGSTALKVSKSRKAIVDAIDKSVADLKAKVQTANEVKKIVVSELNQTREDVLKPRNEWQAEQDRIEAERVAEIKGRIANIESIGVYAIDENKEELAHRIDALEAMDVSEGFSEFTAEAAAAIASATKSLNDRILQIIEEEKAEAQRKQLEAEQKKNRIQERLTNLVQIPLGLMGKHSSDIQAKIDSLQAFAVLEEDFEDRTEEAKASLSQVVSQLGMMVNQAKQLEEAQAKAQAEEQAKREQEEADRLQREAEEKAKQPEPTPEPIQQAVVKQVAEPKTVREFLTQYNESKGYGTDDESLVEALIECGTRVHTDPDIDMHRWYGIQTVVNELDGVFVMFNDYLITGDNGMDDMGLSHDLDEMAIVHKKERTVIEVYYE